MTNIKIITKPLVVLVTATMLVAMVLPALVYAQSDSISNENEVETSEVEATDVDKEETGDDSSSEATEAEKSDKQREDVKTRVQELREEAKQRVEAARENVQEKSAEVRRQVCEAKEAQLIRLMNRISTVAEKHIDKLDSVNARVTSFVEENGLAVENYDRLVAVVSETQAAATLDVDSLASIQVDFDCDDPDVALLVGAYRDAVESVKESLREYRVALSDMIQAVKAAATVDDTADDAEEEEEL